MDARERAAQAILNLDRVTTAALLHPAPRKIFKLQQKEPWGGQVLSIEQRLVPGFRELDSGKTTVQPKENKGGVFLSIVPQLQGLGKSGFPEGDWDSDKAVTALLGVPDVAKLIATFEAVRFRTGEVPVAFRYRKTPQPNELCLYHDSTTAGGEGSTSIWWSFFEENSRMRLVKKAKEHEQSIALGVEEEVILVDYLRGALRGFNTFGY